MKTRKICFVALLMMSTVTLFGQDRPPIITFGPNSYEVDFSFDKRYKKEYAHSYNDIEGSPYLNNEFVNGIFYIKDTVAIKLPIRYNIYSDQMEYQSKGENYVVGSPQNISRVVLGESEFIYLPLIRKSGFFELFVSGKCKLVQKMRVDFIPSEGSKPIVGMTKARFERFPDVFYVVNNKDETLRIGNMKSVLTALQDKKSKVESFIKKERIRNTKKENLIKIINYYNSL